MLVFLCFIFHVFPDCMLYMSNELYDDSSFSDIIHAMIRVRMCHSVSYDMLETDDVLHV